MKNAFLSSRRRISLMCGGALLVVTAIALLASATIFHPAHAYNSAVPIQSFNVLCEPNHGFQLHVRLVDPAPANNSAHPKEVGLVVADRENSVQVGSYTYTSQGHMLRLIMSGSTTDVQIRYFINARNVTRNGGNGTYTAMDSDGNTVGTGTCSLDPQNGGTF